MTSELPAVWVLGKPGWVQLEEEEVALQREAPGGRYWEAGREGGRVCHCTLEELAPHNMGREAATWRKSYRPLYLECRGEEGGGGAVLCVA